MASRAPQPIDWTPNGSFTVLRGHTYHYVHLPVAGSTKPTLLLLHGFPESPAVFTPIASWLHHDLGYPLLVPYLLGYLPTSRPESPAEYTLAAMAADLGEILAHEGVVSVVSIGRDWGAALSTRVPLVLPEVTRGCVSMCVQFLKPADLPRDRGDLPRWIAERRREYGVDYDNYNYFRYFAEPATPPVWEADQRRVWQWVTGALHLMYEGDALKDFFAKGSSSSPSPPAEAAERGFVERWTANGWRGPLNWYAAIGGGLTRKTEEGAPWFADPRIDVPTLYVGGGQDKACPPGGGMEEQRKWVTKLTAVELPQAGHDLGASDPEGCKRALGRWLADNGFGGGGDGGNEGKL